MRAPLILAIALSVGCGSGRGNVTDDAAADSGGSAATGGSSAGTGGSSAGTGGSSAGTGGAAGAGRRDGGPADDGAAASCPATKPSGLCPVDPGICHYGEEICACYPQRLFLPDGGVGSRGGWGCAPLPPAPCPPAPPADGATCDQEGLRCNYDVRPCAASRPSLHVCEGGMWREHPTPCS